MKEKETKYKGKQAKKKEIKEQRKKKESKA